MTLEEQHMKVYKRIDKAKFMAKNPTLIGVVGALTFYEHPTYGDEIGLIAVSNIVENLAIQTDYYDLPTLEELEC